MGCGSSRVAAVKPAQPSGLVGENEKCTLETDTQRDFSREDSALSKRTTDSGLGPEPGEAVAPPPAAGVTKLPPVRGPAPIFAQQDVGRQESHEILEQLLNQGIIPAHPRLGEAGKAYSVMVEDTGKPLRRLPTRLESLKTRNVQQITREGIEARMTRAEERRKAREEELKQKLRNKSAYFRGSTRPKEEEEEQEKGEEKKNSHNEQSICATRDPTADRELMPMTQATEQHSCRGSYKEEGEEEGANLMGYLESDDTFQRISPVKRYNDDDDFFQS